MKKTFKGLIGLMSLVTTLTLGSCGTTSIKPSTEEDKPGLSQTEVAPPESETTTIPVATYTVKWQVEGKIVETDLDVKEGTTPTYDGAVPNKEGNAQYSYTFKGWTPKIAPVTADVTYTAEFTQSVNKYTVTFDTQEGSEIKPITADYGTSITEPEAPTKEGFKFVGWSYKADGSEEVTFPFELKENKTIYAIWNENVKIMGYLKSLLRGFKVNPLSFIPEEVLPTNDDNLIANEASMTFDYKNPVNVSSIQYQGYGEQWNMVVDNLQQSMIFFDLLSVVETIADASIVAFNNYFDKNPADSASHTTKVGDYDVTIKFADDVIAYALSFTTKGDHTAEIWLNLNVETGERAGRLQIGDVNALKYISNENGYEFALRFAGVRRSYFNVMKDENGNISGQINEHTGLDGKLDVVSAAQFFIDKSNLIVVGNKTDAMLGSHPVIVEAYDVTNGHLIGYEVQETLTILGKEAEYNTLWFNLDDQTGINQFQIAEITDAEGHVDHETRINGQDKEFKTKLVGGLNLKTASRRYDLELRDRYYTTKTVDAEGKATYTTKGYKVPMLFVQQEMLEDFEKDVNKENKGLNMTLDISQTNISLITENYATRIKPFNLIKDAITQQVILDFIGTSFVA